MRIMSNFSYIGNSSLLYEMDGYNCVFSCAIKKRGYKNKIYYDTYAEHHLLDLIKNVRTWTSITDLILLNRKITIYCFNAFWRDIYNPLNNHHTWIKKEFVFTRGLTKIESVTTYYKDKVTISKYSLREDVIDTVRIENYEYHPNYSDIKVKYLDKVYRTEHAVYVVDGGNSFSTLEEAITNATNCYNDNGERYYNIYIFDYTISDNPIIDKDKEYTIEELKIAASKNTNHRYIQIDKDKKKVLCEYFENDAHFDIEFKYDYGMLYGGVELIPYRKYKSISGYSLGDTGEMIFEGSRVIDPVHYGELKDMVNPDKKYSLKDKYMGFVTGYFYDADEDYYSAYDSAPGIIPAEDLVPVYDYNNYDQFKVHVGANWEESDKFKGETKEYPFYYKQEFFVKELVGVTDFISFVKLEDDWYHSDDEILFETKYAYIKLFNDNGNVTIYMDRVRGIYLDFDKGGDLVFMIPKKKEEA